MRLLTLLLVLFLFIQLTACQPDADAVPTPAGLVERTWFRSHEEETANSDVRVYRPEGYPFPPSWPRSGFLFYADGRLVEYSPAANDGGSIPNEVGTWAWEKDPAIHVRLSAQYGAGDYKLKVIELTDDVLNVQQLPERLQHSAHQTALRSSTHSITTPMRTSTLALSAFLLLQLCPSCKQEANGVEPTICPRPDNPSLVFSTDGWFYSSEKDKSGALVCRPNRKEFWDREATRPFGAFTGFRLEADGNFLGWGSGPADGIEYYPGKWVSESNQTFRITPTDAAKPSYRLQVLSSAADKLLVKLL